MADSVQKHARQLFKAGFNLLQGANKNDSSDDDDGDFVDSNSNHQSIRVDKSDRDIVFRAYSVKTDREKTLRLNLYRAQVTQLYESSRKVYNCDEMINIGRNAENHVIIEIKKPMAIQSHNKRIIFQTEHMAHQFHQYIEFINESGKYIRSAFNEIDFKRKGFIVREDLVRAMIKVDLKASEEDVTNMLVMGNNVEGTFDYSDFFHLFLNSFVSNPRECLQEWLIQASAISADSVSSLARIDTHLNALPGEVIAFAPSERVHWCVYGGKSCKHPHFIPGAMYATNYRVVLLSLRKVPIMQHNHSRFDVAPYFNMISIPLATLQRVHIAPPRNSIYLTGKDYRTLRITLSGHENTKNKVETFVQVLQGMSFYGSLVPGAEPDPKTHLFAYKHLRYFSNNELGWNQSDIVKEYVRQGLYDSPDWQIYDNSNWSLVESYPRYLALPMRLTKPDIAQAAAFRSKQRLPVITYLHRTTGAVLTRSAQPMVGLTQKNCVEDEKLLNLYRCKGKVLPPGSDENEYSKLYILDARGKIAATLNMAVGKGTEDVTQYKNTELIFCNIDNIHVMRSSALALADALTGHNLQSSGMKEVAMLQDGSAGGYFAKLEESGWIKHTRLILITSIIAAEKLHFEGASVLIHCSDGWDRTAQTCSICQIMLDPYFRTIEGLAALIEKDWCVFGHKFQDRCGHGQDHTHLAEERSPVFVQFLDVLHQLLHQFPFAFEYTDQLLLFLADHVTSCLFGNFLGNCEKERVEELEVKDLTKSIWAYVFDRRPLFLNTHYTPYDRPIWPVSSMTRIVVWERYWLRWDIASHPNRLMNECWHDDWGNGAETDPSTKENSSSYSFVQVPKEETRRKSAIVAKRNSMNINSTDFADATSCDDNVDNNPSTTTDVVSSVQYATKSTPDETVVTAACANSDDEIPGSTSTGDRTRSWRVDAQMQESLSIAQQELAHQGADEVYNYHHSNTDTTSTADLSSDALPTVDLSASVFDAAQEGSADKPTKPVKPRRISASTTDDPSPESEPIDSGVTYDSDACVSESVEDETTSTAVAFI